MSSKTPTVKQVAWISILPQMIVMGLLMFLWYHYNQQDFIIYGAGSYLVLSYILRTSIPKEHRNGMKKVKTENFESAIPNFERSYEFFQKHDWIDKFRFLVLLSSSRITYKEMALNNIAFCYGQIGQGDKSREFYKRTLKEYPDSGMAKAGLRLLNSTSKNE
jgi:tetratricopeptide (TPR) repeat protein